jgi:hypothetical protein
VPARALLALGIVLAAVGCGGQTTAPAGSTAPSSTSPSSSSGLFGKVTIAPGTPTCRAGTSCTRPAAGIVLVFSRYGKDVVSAKTDKAGHYRVALDPGRYGVSARGRRAGGQTLKPGSVAVRSGGMARLDLKYDVGIR